MHVGHSIHFFKDLLNEEAELTWEKLKEELLEQDGGNVDGNLFEQLSTQCR